MLLMQTRQRQEEKHLFAEIELKENYLILNFTKRNSNESSRTFSSFYARSNKKIIFNSEHETNFDRQQKRASYFESFLWLSRCTFVIYPFCIFSNDH